MSVVAVGSGPGEQGRLAALRLAFAGTSCLVICEAMQWTPTFLAPVLTVVLLGNLPGRPPAKVIVALVLVTAVSALGSFVLASLLRFVPVLLAAAIALSSLLCFHSIASGKPVFPALLALICLATIPVAVMVAPAQAGALPVALIRGIAMALAGIWVAHALWPATPIPPSLPPIQAPPDPVITPLARALVSVAVVMPVMLVYLLFGLADVLPVLVATVMLVVTFDARRSLLQAVAMVLGNLAGGFVGLLLYAVLLITPNLALLALLVFTTLLVYGRAMATGGPTAAVLLIACNATLIIFSSAVAAGPAPLSIWWGRLFQFAVAGAFSVAAMSLFWRYRAATRYLREPTPVHD